MAPPSPEDLYSALSPLRTHTSLSPERPEHLVVALQVAHLALRYVPGADHPRALDLVRSVGDHLADLEHGTVSPGDRTLLGTVLEAARSSCTASDVALQAVVLALLMSPYRALSVLEEVAGPAVLSWAASTWQDLDAPATSYLLGLGARTGLPWWACVRLARLHLAGLASSPRTAALLESLVVDGSWYADDLEDALSDPAWGSLPPEALEVGLTLLRDGTPPGTALGAATLLAG